MPETIIGLFIWVLIGTRFLLPIPEVGISRYIRYVELSVYFLAPPIASALSFLGIDGPANIIGGSALRNIYAAILIFTLLGRLAGWLASLFTPHGEEKIKFATARFLMIPIGTIFALSLFGAKTNPAAVSQTAQIVPDIFVSYFIYPLAAAAATFFSRFL